MPVSRKHRRALFICCLTAVLYLFVHRHMTPEPAPLHIAMISDSQRLDYALQVAKSASFFTHSRRLHAHFVVPRLDHNKLRQKLQEIGLRATLHDYDHCLSLVAALRPFSDPSIHTSALCKVFLGHIIPVDRVLYIDSDAVVAADLEACYTEPPSKDTLYSMAVDMGDACQLFPQRCWPSAFQYKIPKGFVCGVLPERYSPSVFKQGGAVCSAAEAFENAQLNGGVVLLELERMRESNFVQHFLASIAATFSQLDEKKARWGDQEFLNNFARYQPKAVGQLSCGCNYQWQGFRKEAKCGRQPVTIAHGWGHGVDRLTHNPYNRLLYACRLLFGSVIDCKNSHYFLNNPEDRAGPPLVPILSPSLPGSPNVSAVLSLNQSAII